MVVSRALLVEETLMGVVVLLLLWWMKGSIVDEAKLSCSDQRVWSGKRSAAKGCVSSFWLLSSNRLPPISWDNLSIAVSRCVLSVFNLLSRILLGTMSDILALSVLILFNLSRRLLRVVPMSASTTLALRSPPRAYSFLFLYSAFRGHFV